MGHFACVFRKKQQRVAAVQDGSPHINTEQEQRSYAPVFIDAVDTKNGSQPWLAEIRFNGLAPLLMSRKCVSDMFCPLWIKS